MAPTALFWLTFGPALAAVVAALVIDAFGETGRVDAAVSSAALLGAGGLVALVGGSREAAVAVYGSFRVGAGYSLVAGAVLVLAAVVTTASLSVPFGRSGRGNALVALAALGSALATSSGDLLATLLALETVAVSGYALVGVRGTRRAREAAFKYFLQGAVASALMVVGLVALASAASGSLMYTDAAALGEALGTRLPVLAAVVLVIIALSFKASAAPMHSWAPDAYEHAPALASGLLAGPVKLGAVAVLSVYLASLVQPGRSPLASGTISGTVAPFLAALAVLSVLVGSLTALRQASYRRMLGYAGVAQAGYGLIALSVFEASAATLHLLMYAIGSVGAFTAAALFESLHPHWDGSVRGLAGLGRRHPVVGAALTVVLASLAGLPPFGGFWGKLRAFSAPIGTGFAEPAWRWPTILLIAAGVIGSIVSLAYYGAVVRELFTGGGRTDAASVESQTPVELRDDAEVPATTVAVLVAVATALVVLGTVTLATGGADPFSRLVFGG